MATNTTVVGSAGRQAEGGGRPVARGVRPAAQEQAGGGRSGHRHPAAVLRHLRAVPRAVALPGPGPARRSSPTATGRCRRCRRTTSSGRTSSGVTCSAGCSTARGSASPSRFVVQAVIIMHRRPDRRPRRLVRRPDRQRPDAPDRRHLRLPGPAVHHPAVGGLPRDGLRPGARRPVPRVRGDRPRRLGDGRPADPRPDARRSRRPSSSRPPRRSASRDRKIVTRHLLPNGMGPIIVAVTLGIPVAILAEATLAYIGIGVQPPRASWGSLDRRGPEVHPLRAAPRASSRRSSSPSR